MLRVAILEIGALKDWSLIKLSRNGIDPVCFLPLFGTLGASTSRLCLPHHSIYFRAEIPTTEYGPSHFVAIMHMVHQVHLAITSSLQQFVGDPRKCHPVASRVLQKSKFIPKVEARTETRGNSDQSSNMLYEEDFSWMIQWTSNALSRRCQRKKATN